MFVFFYIEQNQARRISRPSASDLDEQLVQMSSEKRQVERMVSRLVFLFIDLFVKIGGSCVFWGCYWVYGLFNFFFNRSETDHNNYPSGVEIKIKQITIFNHLRSFRNINTDILYLYTINVVCCVGSIQSQIEI